MHYHYLTLIFYFVTLLFSFTDSAINSKGIHCVRTFSNTHYQCLEVSELRTNFRILVLRTNFSTSIQALLVTQLISKSTNSLASCFNQSLHKALSNADPTAEFFNSSPLDCIQFCYKIQSCHIMVYHKHFSSCQLYSQIVGNGAREVLANGHDLYKRKEFCGLQEDENSEENEN
uniref:Apple domain-containing protein n=1 Tax=Meloidogyne incognita TaxID=6306 RepID=A0A914NQ94_MELIC